MLERPKLLEKIQLGSCHLGGSTSFFVAADAGTATRGFRLFVRRRLPIRRHLTRWPYSVVGANYISLALAFGQSSLISLPLLSAKMRCIFAGWDGDAGQITYPSLWPLAKVRSFHCPSSPQKCDAFSRAGTGDAGCGNREYAYGYARGLRFAAQSRAANPQPPTIFPIVTGSRLWRKKFPQVRAVVSKPAAAAACAQAGMLIVRSPAGM